MKTDEMIKLGAIATLLFSTEINAAECTREVQAIARTVDNPMVHASDSEIDGAIALLDG